MDPDASATIVFTIVAPAERRFTRVSRIVPIMVTCSPYSSLPIGLSCE